MIAILVIALFGLTAYFLLENTGGNSVGSEANLSATAIAGYAQNAGFTGDDLVTAIAVALAESSGNPNAYNPETGAGAPENMGSYGLWQIYLNAHPEFAGQNLYDPQTNANAAFEVWGGGSGWAQWSTYKSGAYEAYIDDANAAVPS